jgi:hypothetical protein
MILPQTLPNTPIAANARIPGRAIVLVTLAAAVLGAIAIARSQERDSAADRRRRDGHSSRC